MSEDMKRKLVRFILSRLLETATGMKLLWLDLDTGRALFRFSPTDEMVTEFLKQVPMAGAA